MGNSDSVKLTADAVSELVYNAENEKEALAVLMEFRLKHRKHLVKKFLDTKSQQFGGYKAFVTSQYTSAREFNNHLFARYIQDRGNKNNHRYGCNRINCPCESTTGWPKKKPQHDPSIDFNNPYVLDFQKKLRKWKEPAFSFFVSEEVHSACTYEDAMAILEVYRGINKKHNEYGYYAVESFLEKMKKGGIDSVRYNKATDFNKAIYAQWSSSGHNIDYGNIDGVWAPGAKNLLNCVVASDIPSADVPQGPKKEKKTVTFADKIEEVRYFREYESMEEANRRRLSVPDTTTVISEESILLLCIAALSILIVATMLKVISRQRHMILTRSNKIVILTLE